MHSHTHEFEASKTPSKAQKKYFKMSQKRIVLRLTNVSGAVLTRKGERKQ